MGGEPRTTDGEKMQRGWIERRWDLYAPAYDLLVHFGRQRQRSIDNLDLRTGERLIVIGCGTGQDLPHIPQGVRVLAVDASPAMLARARRHSGDGVSVARMDATHLQLPDETFDAAVLHLILAVTADPAACLREAARVLVPGGRIAVFDKLVPDGHRAGLARRVLSPLLWLVATHLDCRLDDIVAASGAPLERVIEEPAAVAGLFRIALLRKAPQRQDEVG